MPELVTLDCSLTHVLQEPNTHLTTVNSLIFVDWGDVVTPQREHQCLSIPLAKLLMITWVYLITVNPED